MKFDANEVRKEMKRLESDLCEGAPVTSNELVITRLLGLADEVSELVGAAAQDEIQRIGDEIMPWHREHTGLQPTVGNLVALGFLQGVTFKAASDNVKDIVDA